MASPLVFFFLALVVQPSHHIIIQAVYRLFHAPLAYCPRKTGDSLPDIWGIPVISHLLPVLSQRKHMFFENKSLCYLTQIYFSLCSKTISFLFFFYWKTRLKWYLTWYMRKWCGNCPIQHFQIYFTGNILNIKHGLKIQFAVVCKVGDFPLLS